MKLSSRREKFVDEYLLDHNGSRAARAAGYSKAGARVTAHRLLTNANVISAINAKRKILTQKFELRLEDIIYEIAKSIEIAKKTSNPLVIIKGYVEIAKLMGFYPDQEPAKTEPKHQSNLLLLKLEALSDHELLEIMLKKQE